MRWVFSVFFLFSFWISATEPNICVLVVAHNQESTIAKCLASVREVADCVCVCDGGSTDKTVEVVERFLKEENIPGKIHRLYDDAFFLAKKTVLELGLSDCYILTIDASQVLSVQSRFKKEDLVEEEYQIPEKVPGLGVCSYKPHLFRASRLGKGVSSRLNTLFIGDEESHSSADKMDLFTLGETKLAQAHFDEAIGYFKRVETNPEEVWLSKYKLGVCYEKKRQWDNALYWYLEAYQQFPDRGEPLRNIAAYYRVHGQNELAYIFAKHGSKITPSKDQLLFPFPPLYDYQFDEELSIVSFYTRFKDDGFEAINDLTLKKYVPGYIKEQAYRNIRFYIEPLKNIEYQPILADLPLIEEGFDETYHPMNPSIVKSETGYKVICRSVNYTQKGAKIFHTIDREGIYRTRNFILDYSPDFKLLSQREIVEDVPRLRHSFLVEGLEDCRLFAYDGSLCFTSSSWNTHESSAPQISFCRLEDEPWEGYHCIETLTPLHGPDPNHCEKNWLPFVKEDQLHLIYSYDPFTIYQPDLDTGASTTILSYKPQQDLSHFRGGAGPIPFKEGYLLLVHEVTFLEDWHRCYLHRFVYLNRDFRVEKVSKPFVFTHFGVEFCASMTLDHTGKKLILGIGIEDREAYLGFIDIHHIDKLL